MRATGLAWPLAPGAWQGSEAPEQRLACGAMKAQKARVHLPCRLLWEWHLTNKVAVLKIPILLAAVIMVVGQQPPNAGVESSAAPRHARRKDTQSSRRQMRTPPCSGLGPEGFPCEGGAFQMAQCARAEIVARPQ